MIGTEDMSTSTGMDISESFRAEDLSKTDFFDFVTSPDLGIGIGVGGGVGVGVGVDVGVSLHHHHQQQPPHQHQHQHHQHQQHNQHHHQQHSSSHAHQAQHHGSDRLSAGNMTHDGGGSAGVSRNGSNASSNSDPTLQGYEFWQADKHSDSRLDSNSIFEDLDRYCWQQQPATATATSTVQSTSTHSSHPAHTSPRHQQQHQQQQQHQLKTNTSTTSSTSTTSGGGGGGGGSGGVGSVGAGGGGGGGSISQPGSSGTVSSIDNTDGQIYTLTVLNGNEPSWLKRTEASDHQLGGTLDLDSLLGSFPGYIKSEYPYDDSGFSTDGTKDANVGNGAGGGGVGGGGGNDITSNGISIPHVGVSHHCGSGGGSGGGPGSQTLPTLVTAISIAGGANVSDVTSLNLGQHLAQFQNNNNDWHMADHNTVEQNTAESLLRSALQGKGYAKGLQSMQNGITLLPPVPSPSVKEDDMRRMLFTPDTDSLNFADSTLSAQIFDDTQSLSHAGHLLVPHSPTTPNAVNVHNNANNNNNAMTSIIVDDVFLSLENAFSDDFEKIKRMANEVQQFCAATTPTSVDYNVNDVIMQISPSNAATAASSSSSTTPQLQQLHSPATTPTGQVTVMHLQQQQQQQQQQQANVTQSTQSLKPEVSTSTSSPATAANRLTGVTKPKKQYKRNTSINNNNNNNSSNNNNNSPNVINHNVNGVIASNANNPNGSSSSNSSSNSPPTNCANSNNNINSTAGTGNSGSGSGGTSGGSQRKERSLHYCSICSKGFKDKYSVNVHIRTHTGEKPFACSLCGKSFRQKAHLAKHYQTHMTQKNNGNLVKGNAAKHPRNTGSSGSNASPTVAQQRQLAAVAAVSLPSVCPGLTLSSSGNVTGLSAGVVLNGPTSGGGPGGIIPPPNGLLTNR